MPPVSTTVLDTFDRTNNNTVLGTGWAAAFGADSLGITGNAAFPFSASYCANYRNTDTVGPNAMMGLEVGALATGDSFASIRADLIAADPTLGTWDGYQLLVYQTRVVLARIDNGAETERINYTSSAPQAGDIYIAERLSGGAWEVWRSRSSTWTSLGTVTDNTYAPATWRVGVDIYGPGGTGRIAQLYGATLVGGVAPSNTVAPVASGTAQVGQTVSCTTGTWTGDATITYAYQWQADTAGNGTFSDISGATSSTYALQAAEQGDDVRCRVTGTNGTGNATASSNELGPVAAASAGPAPDCYVMTAGGLVACASRRMTASGLFPAGA